MSSNNDIGKIIKELNEMYNVLKVDQDSKNYTFYKIYLYFFRT